METMAKRIKSMRLEYEMTQEQLADALGLQKSAIAKYENGRVTNIKRSIIEKMSKIFHCDPSWLMGIDDSSFSDNKRDVARYPGEHNVEQRSYPMLGVIACGEPIFMDEEHETYIMSEKPIKADFEAE